MISSEEPAKQRVQVHGRSMAYVERGTGDPIVLLHGNPTSSHLWRNVIPHLEGLGRCIARAIERRFLLSKPKTAGSRGCPGIAADLP